ncbi:MAG: hypothetical protein P4M11_00930, partial [Candidatus Pacebacteria bacterium]|nr:hypothetical protein [Candidatus Paceibacterota bacterium]
PKPQNPKTPKPLCAMTTHVRRISKLLGQGERRCFLVIIPRVSLIAIISTDDYEEDKICAIMEVLQQQYIHEVGED